MSEPRFKAVVIGASAGAVDAPPNYHLLVEANGYLSLSNEEEVFFSRPSIDVLFESAADCYGDGLIGIILSGANADGSLGLKEIEQAGGVALVQRPDSARAAAMPQAALDACPSAQAMDFVEIVAYLKEATS